MTTNYHVTEKGVSCKDVEMHELKNEDQCRLAVKFVLDKLPNATYISSYHMEYKPPGCFYSETSKVVYWNTNSQGRTSPKARSICKG